jgi:hypothetical protein
LQLGMMTSIVRGGFGIFRIAPPLTIAPHEIDLGLEIFDKALGPGTLRLKPPSICLYPLASTLHMAGVSG